MNPITLKPIIRSQFLGNENVNQNVKINKMMHKTQNTYKNKYNLAIGRSINHNKSDLQHTMVRYELVMPPHPSGTIKTLNLGHSLRVGLVIDVLFGRPRCPTHGSCPGMPQFRSASVLMCTSYCRSARGQRTSLMPEPWCATT